MTRATAYTPETVAKIIAAVKAGNTVETSAMAAHVSPRTVREWITTYPEFEDELDAAKAAAEMERVARLTAAGEKGDTGVDRWMLERSNPLAWGRVDRVEAMLRQELARQVAEQLRREGISVTEEEVLKDYNSIAHRALPDGTRLKRSS